MDKTPDHTVFLQNPPEDWSGKACLKIFNIFKGQLQAKGYMGEVFTFRGCLSPHFQGKSLGGTG